jgi:hypothetical protein
LLQYRVPSTAFLKAPAQWFGVIDATDVIVALVPAGSDSHTKCAASAEGSQSLGLPERTVRLAVLVEAVEGTASPGNAMLSPLEAVGKVWVWGLGSSVEANTAKTGPKPTGKDRTRAVISKRPVSLS